MFYFLGTPNQQIQAILEAALFEPGPWLDGVDGFWHGRCQGGIYHGFHGDLMGFHDDLMVI